MSSRVFVFVHGSFANSSVWTPLTRELTLRGHRALAVDMPGHGFDATIPDPYLGGQDLAALATAPSGMAGIGTERDVELVGEVVRRAAGVGEVALVGHSRGGLTVTAVANRFPELISRLVYVAAWCPSARSVADYHRRPENRSSLMDRIGGLAVGDPAVLGAIRLNWRTADPAELDTLRDLLLAGRPRAELIAYLQAHQPDESILVDEDAVRADPDTWGLVRRSYLRLPEDQAFPVALQDLMISDADRLTPDNRFDVHSVAGGHVAFQLHTDQVADILDGLPA